MSRDDSLHYFVDVVVGHVGTMLAANVSSCALVSTFPAENRFAIFFALLLNTFSSFLWALVFIIIMPYRECLMTSEMK